MIQENPYNTHPGPSQGGAPSPAPTQHSEPAHTLTSPNQANTTQTAARHAAIKGILALLVLVAIVTVVVVSTISQNSATTNLIEKGVQVEGTSTGEAEYQSAGGRRARGMYYFAEYEYTRKDGTTGTALGERPHESRDEITVGMKAKVYYDPNDTSKVFVADNE